MSGEELGISGGDDITNIYYDTFENKDAIPEMCADYCFNVHEGSDFKFHGKVAP